MKKLLIISIGLMVFAYNLIASIGVVAAAKGEAYIQRAQKNIKAKIGNQIEKSDAIITKEDGKLQLIFNDKTVVTIGKNSKFSIKEYLFDGTKKSKVLFSMTKGLFATISGKIGKIARKRFKLKTKNATIGIRGTEIIIEASPLYGDKIACTRGAIEVTSNFTGKSVYVEAGKITVVKPHSSPTPPKKLKSGDIKFIGKTKKKNSTKKKSKNINKTPSKKRQKIVKAEKKATKEKPKPQNLSTLPEKTITTKQNDKTVSQTSSVNNIEITQNVDLVSKTAENIVETQNSDNAISSVKQEAEKVVKKPPAPPENKVFDLSKETAINVDIPNPVNDQTGTDIDTIENSSSGETIYSDDYLSFGYWMNSKNNPIDTWINGTVTPIEVIEGYIENHLTANYTGDVAVITNGKAAAGSFNMNVDFGSQSLSGIIKFQAKNEPLWNIKIADGVVTPSYFKTENVSETENSEVKGISGTISGGFYGSNGERIGGKFQLKSSSNGLANGVFGGTKQ